MKEFAARKTLGAKTKDLVIQFMSESTVMNVIALLLALTLVQIFGTLLQTYFGIYIPDWEETSYDSMGIIMSIIVFGVLITGLYPALITNRRTPKSLFNTSANLVSSEGYSHWLTVMQYMIAVSLIIWTFAIVLQVNFMLNKDLGLDKSSVLAIDLPVGTKYDQKELNGFLRSVSTYNDVIDYAISRSVAGDDPVRDAWLSKPGFDYWGGGYTNGGVDERFLPFYNIDLIAGRNFLHDSPEDEKHIIVDMNALAAFKITEANDAIGLEVLAGSMARYAVVSS